MTNFEHMKSFKFLKFAHVPKKHWTNSSGWEIATTLHNVVLNQMKLVVEKIGFISMNCDEVRTLDNQSWIFVYAYIVEDWKKVLILLNLEKFVDGATFDNLSAMIVRFLIIFGGLL